METSCDLLTMERCFTFCGHNLTITQRTGKDLLVSALVWDAGIVLCHYFEEENLQFHGKRVIELGSGTGIVGILAVLLGGNVTLTDRPSVLKQMQHNVSVNIPSELAARATISPFSWGIDERDYPSDYDIVLGSDIVYNRSTFPTLLNTLKYLSNAETVTYLSSEMRKDLRAAQFYLEVLPQHFNCNLVYRNKEKNINVYRVTRKPPAHMGGTCTDKSDL
uniref:Protein-lysine methyltransferase METTL21B-like n=2 Tax=Callorhinchus milii TaxID=7868 RepID=A0A4W3K1V1_CALMI